jgi:hypothetical protein
MVVGRAPQPCVGAPYPWTRAVCIADVITESGGTLASPVPPYVNETRGNGGGYILRTAWSV